MRGFVVNIHSIKSNKIMNNRRKEKKHDKTRKKNGIRKHNKQKREKKNKIIFFLSKQANQCIFCELIQCQF